LRGIDSLEVDFVASPAESVTGAGGLCEGRDKAAPTPEGQWGSEGIDARESLRSERRNTNMSSSTFNTKAAALAHVLALIAGTQKHLPNGSFTIGSVTYTSASLIQAFQDLVSAMQARDVAEIGAKDALTTEQATQAKVGPILRAYERLVLATFPGATQTLADFGLAPPKARTPLTVQQLTVRAAKAKATRIARGTTSKKQKLAVKGDVTGVIVTPVTLPTAATPASPVPPVTPSPKPAQPATTTSSEPSTGLAAK
jgi:hypothetical protein